MKYMSKKFRVVLFISFLPHMICLLYGLHGAFFGSPPLLFGEYTYGWQGFWDNVTWFILAMGILPFSPAASLVIHIIAAVKLVNIHKELKAGKLTEADIVHDRIDDILPVPVKHLLRLSFVPEILTVYYFVYGFFRGMSGPYDFYTRFGVDALWICGRNIGYYMREYPVLVLTALFCIGVQVYSFCRWRAYRKKSS